MASGNTTGTVQCPECKQPVEFPVRTRYSSTTEAVVSFDLGPVYEHVASHEASFTLELPPTAR